MNEEARQRRVSYHLLLMMLWASLLMLVIEVTAGWVTHSLALLAEALHTLIDVFSTVLSLVAIASPQRTLGREIWGHGRGEVGGALILSGGLGFAGLNLLWVALRQYESIFQQQAIPFPVEVPLSLIQLMSALMAVLLTLVLIAAYQSRFLASVALRCNTHHVLRDIWLSLVILLGLVAIWQGHHWIDPLFAIVLTLLTVSSFWQVLDTHLPMLLRPTAIAPEAIAQVAQQVKGVTHCTRILSRGMVGRQVWIDLHIALHPEFMSLSQSIGDRVEGSLRQQFGPVRVQIWIEQNHITPLPASRTGPLTPPPRSYY